MLQLKCYLYLTDPQTASSSFNGTKSNVKLHLLNGLLPVSSVFYLSFQFVIFHLLISVCTQLHHLFFGHLLSQLLCGLLLNNYLLSFYYPFHKYDKTNSTDLF